MRVLVARGRTVSLLPDQERGRVLLVREVPKVTANRPRTDESFQSGGADGMLPLSAAWTHEEGLPPETGIPGFWDSTVPVSSRIGEDTVRSSTAQYRPNELVSVSGSYTSSSHFIRRPERPEYG